MNSWFLLNSGPCAAPFNMALDEALLEAMPRLQKPGLRFYGWTERAATFGYFQRYAEVGRATLMRPLIRRPTGGGIVLSEANWPRLRALGPVVCLTAEVETILERVGTASDRPLLAGEPAEVRERAANLLATRREAYARADWICATDGKSPAEIAEQIIQRYQLISKAV